MYPGGFSSFGPELQLGWTSERFIVFSLVFRTTLCAFLLRDCLVLIQNPRFGACSLLRYNPRGRHQAQVYEPDIARLEPPVSKAQHLNDAIINFFTLYLTAEVMTDEQRRTILIWNTFFFTNVCDANAYVTP